MNFTTSAGAERFRHAYNGRPWEAEYQTKKIVSIKNSHIQVTMTIIQTIFFNSTKLSMSSNKRVSFYMLLDVYVC